VLIDESDLLLGDAARVLTRGSIGQFVEVLETFEAESNQLSTRDEKWLTLTHQIAQARTEDLQQGDWRFPRFTPEWALQMQQLSREIHGDNFNFPAFDLQHFGFSDRSSRERLPNGDIRHATRPYLGENFIVFSGSIAKELVRYRIDPNHRLQDISAPFSQMSFSHPGTRWYNLRSMAAAARFFPNNATSILDFFAAKIARNIEAGKRTLLIARKKFLGTCENYLRCRLNALGISDVKLTTEKWGNADLENPRTLPLINYGVSGVNRFEHFDAAYCLTGYYISSRTLTDAVYDIDASCDRFPISIRNETHPRRRRAIVELPDDRATNLPLIAQLTLQQKEVDVVIQAVGRVRPFTRPREIITFQADELANVTIDFEFTSLDGARSFFKIPKRQRMDRDKRASFARQLRDLGLSIPTIMRATGCSRSTIKRYLSDHHSGGSFSL
jgi:hypothetical protein